MKQIRLKINGSYYNVVEEECVYPENKAEINYTNREIRISPKYLFHPKGLHLVIHEITHAYIYETQITPPPYSEESVCEFMSIYGSEIINVSKTVYRKLKQNSLQNNLD